MTTTSADYKRQTAGTVTTIFRWTSVIGFVLIAVGVVLGLIVSLCFKEDDKVLAAKLIYSATGILIGALEVVLGILLSLIGLTADYDIDASVGSAKIKLASASPGLLLVVCGNLLMGFSLMREFRYAKVESGGQQEAARKVNPPDVKPMPPVGPQ